MDYTLGTKIDQLQANQEVMYSEIKAMNEKLDKLMEAANVDVQPGEPPKPPKKAKKTLFD